MKYEDLTLEARQMIDILYNPPGPYKVGDKFIIVCDLIPYFKKGDVIELGAYIPHESQVYESQIWAFIIKGIPHRHTSYATIENVTEALQKGFIVPYNELTKELYGQ